jgi:Kef-type K+ transport system membrane component KefB
VSNIEVIICLVLLFMAVPDFCRRLGRPSLAFSAFVLVGIGLNPLVGEGVETMLMQAGEVGFLLLLFGVGQEIDLPPLREMLKPLRHAAAWAGLQYPLVFGLGWLAGRDWTECFLAAAALTACSIGMAHTAWKGFPDMNVEAKAFTLHVMVALEVMAIVVLAVESTALGHGFGWALVLKLAGIVVTILLLGRFAAHLQGLFQAILDRTTHWRVHWLVLLVLLICTLGDRLGLDAPKTAFFLGLALSAAKHNNLSLEEHIAPISEGFLIPIFFVALGLQIDWRLLFSLDALLAAGAAGLLLGVRSVIHRFWLKTGGPDQAFLLLCPNLTIVALAAKALQARAEAPRLTALLVLTGLFMTVPSLLLLPRGTAEAPDSPGKC